MNLEWEDDYTLVDRDNAVTPNRAFLTSVQRYGKPPGYRVTVWERASWVKCADAVFDSKEEAKAAAVFMARMLGS